VQSDDVKTNKPVLATAKMMNGDNKAADTTTPAESESLMCIALAKTLQSQLWH
jgi:hypothetical protein